MSGRCLHFMGLLPKMRVSRHPTSALNISIQQSQKGLYVQMVRLITTFPGLRPERLTSNQIASQHRISFAWRHKQPIYLSRLVGKPTICIGENKGADQLRGDREADQRFCFRYSDSTFPLLLKSEISSF